MADRPALVRCILIIALLLPGSLGRAGELCVVRQEPLPGLEVGALAAAVAVEGRKAEAEVALVEAASADGCAGGVVAVIGPGGRLLVTDRAGVERTLLLGPMEPLDRAREAARVLVTLALTPPGEAPLLDPDAPIEAPVAVARVGDSPSATAETRVVLEAGASWRNTLAPGGDRGAVEALAGVALFGERMLVGVEGGFEWPVSASSAGVETTVMAGDVLAVVRAGAPVGPFVLRGGLAGGAQWRTIEAAAPARRDASEGRAAAGVLAAELEATWLVGPLRVGAVASGRLYLGGESYRWLGQTVWEAPDGAVGLGVRVGGAL